MYGAVDGVKWERTFFEVPAVVFASLDYIDLLDVILPYISDD